MSSIGTSDNDDLVGAIVLLAVTVALCTTCRLDLDIAVLLGDDVRVIGSQDLLVIGVGVSGGLKNLALDVVEASDHNGLVLWGVDHGAYKQRQQPTSRLELVKTDVAWRWGMRKRKQAFLSADAMRINIVVTLSTLDTVPRYYRKSNATMVYCATAARPRDILLFCFSLRKLAGPLVRAVFSNGVCEVVDVTSHPR